MNRDPHSVIGRVGRAMPRVRRPRVARPAHVRDVHVVTENRDRYHRPAAVPHALQIARDGAVRRGCASDVHLPRDHLRLPGHQIAPERSVILVDRREIVRLCRRPSRRMAGRVIRRCKLGLDGIVILALLMRLLSVAQTLKVELP
jgi:hypothetical protein